MENKKSKLYNYLRVKASMGGVLGRLSRILYKLYSEQILGCDIPYYTKIGNGFTLFHGAHGSVVNGNTIIGNDVSLRQNTTIGSKNFTDDITPLAPTIEDRVQIGPNVCIIGKITIGHDSMIGAGAVVVKDVPPYSVVVGNPAKVVKTNIVSH